MQNGVRMLQRQRGFSLTELVVTVAIAGILTAIAIPTYRNYVLRANRADATSALLRLAGNQERFYLANNRYADDGEMADAPPAGLGIAGTERGFYELTIASDDLATGYTATATAAAGGQEGDDACGSFTVDERGLRAAADTGGGDNTEECWR